MQKIKVTDTFRVSDKKGAGPVKGLVVLRNDKGEIIFKKNNLVVKAGRKIIKQLFFKSLAIGDTTETQVYYTPSIIIGSGTTVTTEDTGTLDFQNSIKLSIGDLSNTSDFVNNSPDASDDIYIQFTVNIKGSGTTAINMSELGICLNQKDATTETDILFSRIVFDPLPFTSSNNYQLEYYLYF